MRESTAIRQGPQRRGAGTRDGLRPAPSSGCGRFRRVRGGTATEVAMRIESSVTTLSWIPSEAVTGVNKGAFEIGFTHYDEPPPDVIPDLDVLRDTDRFRFANRLTGWV